MRMFSFQNAPGRITQHLVFVVFGATKLPGSPRVTKTFLLGPCQPNGRGYPCYPSYLSCCGKRLRRRFVVHAFDDKAVAAAAGRTASGHADRRRQAAGLPYRGGSVVGVPHGRARGHDRVRRGRRGRAPRGRVPVPAPVLPVQRHADGTRTVPGRVRVADAGPVRLVPVRALLRSVGVRVVRVRRVRRLGGHARHVRSRRYRPARAQRDQVLRVSGNGGARRFAHGADTRGFFFFFWKKITPRTLFSRTGGFFFLFTILYNPYT